MAKRSTIWLLAGGLCLWGSVERLNAQTAGGGGTTGATRGLFGDRTLGTSLSAGQRTFGGSQSIGATTQASANVGQVTGNERFVRGSQNANQFIGSDSADLGNFINSLSGGRGNQQGGLGLGGNLGGRNQAGRNNFQQGNNFGGQGGNNGRQSRTVRATLSVGFDYARPAATAVGAVLATRINRSTRIQMLAPVQVAMEDRTAVLRGIVATPHDRVLAEQLALLEAGISRVRNELTVAPPDNPPIPRPDQP